MAERTELEPKGARPPTGTRSQKSEIAAFLAEARARMPRTDGSGGRLIFALDATMSRQPTWDAACSGFDAGFAWHPGFSPTSARRGAKR